jgi:antitoxin component YwqK of YwqJK toxin-antitoxin module
MIRSYQRVFFFYSAILAMALFLAVLPIYGCFAQSPTDTVDRPLDLKTKIAPESQHFVAYRTEKSDDSSRAEFDTVTGYGKYYYANGKLKMEGKVTGAPPNGFRDGIWDYYNDQGQLMSQETYARQGKINELKFMYFKNGKPLSETYQYFKGDYKDKASFQFIKIEIHYYTNGQKLSEEHSVNEKIVYRTCWDSKGNEKPIEYLKTIKSVSVDD